MIVSSAVELVISLTSYFRYNSPPTRVTQQSAAPSAATPKVASRPQAQASPKPYIIPPLPFEFLWDVPQSDEAAYRRGETVYTFAERPGDMYKAHYWMWHDFKTGKPQYPRRINHICPISQLLCNSFSMYMSECCLTL